jgi:hypothetical protein
MKVIVLCVNDCTIGVYATAKKTDVAALNDWKRREPRWKTEKLKMGQTYSTGLGNYVKWHYHQHMFKVDEEAKP